MQSRQCSTDLRRPETADSAQGQPFRDNERVGRRARHSGRDGLGVPVKSTQNASRSRHRGRGKTWRPKGAAGLGGRKLIVKLNRRRHVATGSRIVRICVCEAYSQDSLELPAPEHFRQVCIPCPAVAHLAHAEGRLFPAWTNGKVPQALRAPGDANGWKNA